MKQERMTQVVGASWLLSVQRHFLFFVLVCFSICCKDAPQSSSSITEFSWFSSSRPYGVVSALTVDPSKQPTSGESEFVARDEKKDEVVVELTDGHHRPRHLTAASNLTLSQILWRAGKRGLGGGLSGAVAGVVQVVALMWLRTITNYQARYGTTFRQALHTLLNTGGIRRLYRGLTFALIQAPLMRFVSTATNDFVESFLSSYKHTASWGAERTTFIASLFVGLARIALMPVDTMKTVLQVDSYEGFRNLMRRLKMGKFMVLYEGSLAVAVMGIVGHYPWFVTYNIMTKQDWLRRLIPNDLCRNALIGFTASLISDTVTNVFRVIKTTKQVTGSKNTSSYLEIIRMIVAADGWKGLFGRGLGTRLASNALQSVLFTVVWRGVAEWLQSRAARNTSDSTKNEKALQS